MNSCKVCFEVLLAGLKAIAAVTGGYAAIVDGEGRRIITVNSKGEELAELRGVVYPEAQEALKAGKPLVAASQIKEGALAWFLPVGEWVLVASNIEKVEEEKRLEEAFIEALPMIATVAGGDAVIFDQNGIRRAGYNPRGEPSRGLGEYSEQCHRVMVERRPLIGPSTLVEGAMAVRIPIGRNFGLSINNEWAVKRQRKLLETMKGFQSARYSFADIIGESQAICRCKQQAQKVAGTNSTVLLRGESGTGKELFAHAIHNASPRRGKPFVAVNCAAIPPTLAETYFFGYEPGAFTGARKEGQEGIFEQANGGTLFLDEVAEMDTQLQAKLLRVLQERQVVRVGGKKAIPLDIRIIVATNKDLEELVQKGEFRQDLYYRLNVVEIFIPPLRERKEDILPLAYHLLRKLNPIMGTSVIGFTDEAAHFLKSYCWPGNARELENCLERALSIAEGKYITAAELPPAITRSGRNGQQRNGPAAEAADPDGAAATDAYGLKGAREGKEKEIIQQALREFGNNRRKAADKLGISTTTLWRKMKKYGL